jgi:hypothetical protein
MVEGSKGLDPAEVAGIGLGARDHGWTRYSVAN